MSNYYTIEDFKEFEGVLKCSINEFVEILNYLVEDETQNEICDFMIIMKYLKQLDPITYKCLINYMDDYGNNTLGVYIYLKFLLLNDEKKTEFVDKYFCKFRIIENINEPMEKFLITMFQIVEDEYLNDFYDYKDNYLQYRKLDIKNIENIGQTKIKYIDSSFIKTFLSYVRIFISSTFIVRFIYLISKDKLQYLKQGETSITTLEDFLRRFEYNRDTFMLLINYYKDIYNISDKIKLNFKIKLDKTPVNKIYPYDKVLTEKERVSYIKKFIYEIICGVKTYVTIKHCFDSFIERYNDTFIKFLIVKYDYDIEKDEYKLIKYIGYNKFHSDWLHKKFKMYINEKLYKSLIFINDVRSSLPINVEKETEKTKSDEMVIELYDYLEKLLKTYYYDRSYLKVN
jgi:hypothetical protein